jgi:hypothetical protein
MVLYGKDQAPAQLLAVAFPAAIMDSIIVIAFCSFALSALPDLHARASPKSASRRHDRKKGTYEFAAAANWFIATVRFPLTSLAAPAFFFPPAAIPARAFLAFSTC